MTSTSTILRFAELSREQKDAALLIECAYVVKRLKEEDKNIQGSLLRLFRAYTTAIGLASPPRAYLRNTLMDLMCGVKREVALTLRDKLYPASLDPEKVYDYLKKHPDNPYQACIL